VGVTEDGRYVNLLDETLPYFFLPLAQSMRSSMTVHVRTRSDSSAMIPAIRSAVRELNANVSTFDAMRLVDRVGAGLLPMQIAAWALGAFGALAMALAAIGLYGVLAHGVSLRRREIGVRVALGAEARDVQTMFVLQGMRLVAIGMAIGLAASLGVTRLLRSFLYGVSPTDAATFATMTFLLAAVAFVATYVPARRAARLDPIRALHED
jgi:ABC-type antimicrobial peptide transport system permease subunit